MDDTRYKIPKIEFGNESEVLRPIEATDDMHLPTDSSLDFLSLKDVSKNARSDYDAVGRTQVGARNRMCLAFTCVGCMNMDYVFMSQDVQSDFQ